MASLPQVTLLTHLDLEPPPSQVRRPHRLAYSFPRIHTPPFTLSTKIASIEVRRPSRPLCGLGLSESDAAKPRAGGANAASSAVPSKHPRSVPSRAEHLSADTALPVVCLYSRPAGTRNCPPASGGLKLMWPRQEADWDSGVPLRYGEARKDSFLTATMPDTSTPAIAPANSLADTLQTAIVNAANDFKTLTSTLKAFESALKDFVNVSASDANSVTTAFSRALGTSEGRNREGGQAPERLTYVESINLKPSTDPALMEYLSGIAAKVTTLYNKSTVRPTQGAGLGASMHAPAPTDTNSGGKGKKRPAIFGEAPPPPKRQASEGETQRVQDIFAIPRDWNSDWTKISMISPLMKVCKGRIPPESALAIAMAFEFRPRNSANDNAVAANPTPLTEAGRVPCPPQAAPVPNSVAAPKPKPKAPVVHVPAPKDPTKLLRVVFSSAVSNIAHRREEKDVRDWIRDRLQRIGEEPNEVTTIRWHEGGVHLDIRFQVRPTVATRDHLNQESSWFANTYGTSRTATVDFYAPITRLAIKALRTENEATHEEFSTESIIAAIAQENTWITEHLLTAIQSPKPHWLNTHGGSGTFVFSVYDNRDGSASAGWCKKKLRVFGFEHTIQRHDVTPRVPLCDRCWHWQHPGTSCKQPKLFCAMCSLPHLTTDHPRFCIHPDCKKARLETLEVRTDCKHVYCANCDSMEHTPSSRDCPFSCHAGDKDAKQWFSKNQAKFSAQEMHQRGRAYDGKVAVDVEKRRRQSEGEPADDAEMHA
ncbi:hypothetical protein BC629DRAFT_1738157 [Irpex lacteus]|nr:hypothetical protein BC629DRAFT_1738157 [Irpex lacteus]